MKAQTPITEFISVLSIGFFMIFFAFVVIPKFMKDSGEIFVSTSADVVSKNLAGLITISSAATENITIIQKMDTLNSLYNVNIKDKKVYVELVDLNGKIIGNAESKTAVDVFSSGNSVNYFLIKSHGNECNVTMKKSIGPLIV